MTSRKLITTIFLIGTITIYSVVWYFVSQNMNGFLTKRMNISQEKVKLFGFPFYIKFKIQDADIETVSYNLLSKKLLVSLKKGAFDFLREGKADAILKDLEYIRFSSKLDSYFTLIRIIQNKGTKFEEIDAFNLFNNIGISLKANIKDPTFDLLLPIKGTWEISIPNKRAYRNFEDILSDLPRYLTLEGSYEEDMIISENVLPFMQKLSKLLYPVKHKLKSKISLSDHVDARNMDEAKFIELMRKLSFDWALIADTNMADSKTTITMNDATDTHNVNIEYLVAYKDMALQNFYTKFNGEDIAAIIETILYKYNVHLNDNSKLKFKLLGDLIVSKIQTEVIKNPDYWKKLSNYKSASKISMWIPYEEGFGGMKYLIDMVDNKNSSFIKIEGAMSGRGIPDSTKGTLLINNKSPNMSEAIEVLRLIYFATNPTVKSDSFKLMLENFDNDIKTINDIFLSLSDDPSAATEKILYSYDISKQEMMNSKLSNSGKTLIDGLVAFAPLFALPEESENK
jgi:hypothetical protein